MMVTEREDVREDDRVPMRVTEREDVHPTIVMERGDFRGVMGLRSGSRMIERAPLMYNPADPRVVYTTTMRAGVVQVVRQSESVVVQSADPPADWRSSTAGPSAQGDRARSVPALVHRPPPPIYTPYATPKAAAKVQARRTMRRLPPLRGDAHDSGDPPGARSSADRVARESR